MLKSILQPILKPMMTGVFGDSEGGGEEPSLPVAPVLATPTVTDTTLVLTWTMSNDTGVTDYVIEYKASSSGTWLVFSDGTSTAKTATVTGLTASTSYDARVKAVNNVGSGDYSNTQTISTKRLLLLTDIGALAWYDMLSGITDAGSGAVSQWNDLTTNARHISQSSGTSRPTLTADGVSFDGSNDHLFNTTPFMCNSANGVHIIAIVSGVPYATLTRRTLCEASTTSTSPRYQMLCKDTGVGQESLLTQEIRNDASATQASYGLNSGTTPVWDSTFKMVEQIDTLTQIKTSVNCVPESTPISYTRSGTYTFDRFCLGGQLSSSFANASQGVFKALAIFPANISASDLEKAQGALAHRHSVTSLLPTGHAYKTNPPLI